MASVDTGGGDSGGKGKHGKKRAKKSSTHIDMTPMVDLAFLLLTFFVLTSTFSKPSTMELTMPSKEKVPPSKVKNIVTVILDKSDTVYYYYGELDTASMAPYKTTNYSKDGIRKVLIDYNKEGFDAYGKVADLDKKLLADKSLDDAARAEKFKEERSKILGTKEALTVVVKTYDNAKYGRVIDILDEMSLTQVGKYALVDMSVSEKAFLQRQTTKK